MESPTGDIITTTSKVAGATSGVAWFWSYIASITLSDVALFATAVGGIFFGIERVAHCVFYLYDQYKKRTAKNGDSNAG